MTNKKEHKKIKPLVSLVLISIISIHSYISIGYAQTSQFTQDTTQGCSPLTVVFTNQSTGAVSYLWDFGDGDISGLEHPTHIFENFSANDTVYTVTLIATAADLNTDTSWVDITVYPYVEADFTFEYSSGCTPFEVTINNFSSIGVSFYHWDFGDTQTLDSTDCAPVFTHTYINSSDSAIIFELTLIVENDSGCNDTLVRNVTVYPEVIAQFTADTTQGCNLLSVVFTNQSIPMSTGTTYNWEYGDGGSSNTSDTTHIHIFENMGTADTVYTVWLTVTSEYLCADTDTAYITVYPYIEAGFTFENNAGCTPFEVTIYNSSAGVSTYHWDFGDTQTLDSIDCASVFTHLYQNPLPSDTVCIFELILIVENDSGCTDTLIQYVTVYPDVVSQFTQDTTQGCNPLLVNFTNQSINADFYNWGFGDGGTSSSTDTSHTYVNLSADDTVYTVCLIATSQYLCADTDTAYITVYPYINADFTFEYDAGCTPFEVTIYNLSDGVSIYHWDFGDGQTLDTTDCAPVFTHLYQNPLPSDTVCIFELILIVENDSGCTDTLIRYVTVYPDVVSQFTQDTTQGCNPLLVNFTDQSVNADFYDWDFGDGGSSSSADTSHLFENISDTNTTYTVSLIASSQYLCADTDTAYITVYPYIEADFTFEYSDGCTPFEVTIYNASVGASQYIWIFGDSDTSYTSAAMFTHTYVNSTDSTIIFEIILIVTNDSNCTDTLRRNVTVYPAVTSQIQPDTSNCHPFAVTFTNLSTGATSYYWDFGDGASSVLTNPSHIFENIGAADTTFTVSCIATSQYLCADTDTVYITVYPKPEAMFTLDNSSGCPPFEITINNSSQGVTTYHWDFGDGQTLDSIDCASVFTHIYQNTLTTDTIFQITLIVENDSGCTDTLIRYVTVYPDIISQFQPDTIGCNPLFVQFTNQTVPMSTGNSYYWDFGDGGTSSATNPSHTFYNLSDTNAVYYVSLIAASEDFCTDTDTVSITVYPYLKADFSFENSAGCAPFEVTINNLSIGASEYYWIFDDGSATIYTTSDTSFTHTYIDTLTIPITYDLQLIAISSDGCSDTIIRSVTVYPINAEFELSDTAGCQPLSVSFTNLSTGATSYYWDFGDGYWSNLTNPSHIFENTSDTDTVYTVWLIASSEYSCIDTFRADITVYSYIEANFTFDYGAGCTPFEVTINNSSLGVDNYYWDFGDSITSDTSASVFTHLYQNPLPSDTVCIFELILIVENAQGCPDTLKRIITVYPEVIAQFTADTTQGCNPLSVVFTNQSTGAFAYSWDFGDANYSTQQNPSHTFYNLSDTNAVYYVSLIATSQFGCTDTANSQITVYPSPVANFIPSPLYQIFPDTTVNIDSVSSGYATYFWNFGDGDTSNLENPISHTYDTWGDYVITLKVCTEYNCCDSVSYTIKIDYSTPIADFTPIDTSGCPPLDVLFINNSINTDLYHWDFGDGGSSTDSVPTYTYYESGTFIVTLTASGPGGQADTTKTITVFNRPYVFFEIEPPFIYIPEQPVHCYNYFSENGATYFWDFNGDGFYDTTVTEANDIYHYYEYKGDYNIILKVCTQNGCCDSLSIPVVAETKCEIIFPNAFTPNNDQNNDVFLPLYEGISEYNLEIFNRWGELIFESDALNTGWDGYYRGELCKQDVYVWKVRAVCSYGQNIFKSGDVTLLR